MTAVASLVLGACGKREDPSQASASASAVAPSPPPAPEHVVGYPHGSTKAIGYPLEIIPGQGIGPIRFGATFDTVERHMTRPCDVRTETSCLYVDQAVDFTMKDGVVAAIHLQRRDRPAPPGPDGKPRYFGSFNGHMPGDFALGLHRHVVDQELRAPDRVETLPAPDKNNTVARYFYDGLVLDFDKIENGATVVGGITILPSPTATNPSKKAPSVAPSAPPPAAPQTSATPKKP